MVVYYTTTYYHILCAILHRLIYKPDSKACILISDNRTGHDKLCERLKQTNIFDEVVYYEDRLLVSMASRKYKKRETKSNMERVLKYVCEEVEKITPFKINSENEYFLMSDFRPIGLYLIKNKIKYHYLEDACGVLSKKHLLMNVLKSKWTNKVIEEFNLNGENDLVINKYADMSAQEEGFYDEKVIDFSVKELVNKISKEDKEKILEVFNVNKVEKDQRRKALILTQPFIERKNISFYKQKDIYALLMDYFCKDMDIYIKPHPLEKLSIYSKWFPYANILEGQMPSELLNISIEDKFDVGISISSTAIYSLDKFLNSIIIFDSDAENKITDINSYYAISKILEKIFTDKYNIILKDINQILLNSVIMYSTNLKEKIEYIQLNENFKESSKNSIYIFNKITDEDLDIIQNIKENDILIALDYQTLYKNDLNFFEKYNSLTKNIKMTIEDVTEKNNIPKQEDILVYTKQKENLDKLDDMSIQNELIHSGLNLKINSYNFISEEMKDKTIEILKKQIKNKED